MLLAACVSVSHVMAIEQIVFCWKQQHYKIVVHKKRGEGTCSYFFCISLFLWVASILKVETSSEWLLYSKQQKWLYNLKVILKVNCGNVTTNLEGQYKTLILL